MKKSITILLLIVMLSCAKGNTESKTEEAEDTIAPDFFKTIEAHIGDFEINEYEFEISITGYNGSDAVIVIPPSIGGKKVTFIEEEAYIGISSGKNLKSIIIPESITSIDIAGIKTDPYDQAFTLIIGADVTLQEYYVSDSIGHGFVSFYNSNGKKAGAYLYNGYNWKIIDGEIVEYSENNFTIDDKGTITAYKGQDKALIIPAKISGIEVMAIGDGVFRDMGLTSVDIPASVISIGDHAFHRNQLTSVNIPAGVTFIGSAAFWNNQLTSVIIPPGVISISGLAFCNNRLTSITIPGSVISIGAYAFSENQLANVAIPGSVSSIGFSAFSKNQLTNVTISTGVTSIDQGAFSSNKLASIIIPDSITSIGECAFDDNQLISIEIGANVTLQVQSGYDPPSPSPSFDIDFDNLYNDNEMKSGIYVYGNGKWGMR